MAPKPSFTGKPTIRLLKDLKFLILETTFLPQSLVDVKWMLDGKELDENEKYKMRVKAGTATLKIKNPVSEDSGKYDVILNNSKGGSVKQILQVQIGKERSKDAPVFVDEPSENWIDDKVGKKLLLKFSVQSITKPIIIWQKDEQPLKPSQRLTMKCKEEFEGKYSISLEIKEPDSGELGEYDCVVKNDFGQLQAMFNLEGEVSKNAPEFAEEPMIIEKEEDGKHVTVFHVAFKTSDDPIVTWLNSKNMPLSDNKRMKISLKKDTETENLYIAEFQLRDYEETDSGVFSCKIQNKTTKEVSIAEIFLNIEF